MRPADAALIEPLSCAVRGFDVLPRQLADHYLIYGSGTMGLMMLELAKRAGAATVYVVDINPTRLETAKRLGCTARPPRTPTSSTAPRGWDVVIDCTGAAAGDPGRAAAGSARAARSCSSGWPNYDTRVTIEPYEIYNQEITITGSMAVLHSFERAGELFAAGVLDPEVFISHRFPLDSYAEALAQFRAGIGRKILIEP